MGLAGRWPPDATVDRLLLHLPAGQDDRDQVGIGIGIAEPPTGFIVASALGVDDDLGAPVGEAVDLVVHVSAGHIDSVSHGSSRGGVDEHHEHHGSLTVRTYVNDSD